jgi:hypothetical protein
MNKASKPSDQSTPADRREPDQGAFDTMMEALEMYFHMATCPDHTKEERTQAFVHARDSFAAFAYDDETPAPEPQKREHVLGDDDPKQNAPSTDTVH